MLNNKYNNVSLFPLMLILLFATLAFYKIYVLSIQITGKSIIGSINYDYSSRIEAGTKLNINELNSNYEGTVLNLYQKQQQPFFSKYEVLDRFYKLNKVGINNFPLDFNKFNPDLFTLDNKDIIFNDSVVIKNNTLKIKKNMYKLNNPDYISTGFWAVYFNDHFQYSSFMDLNIDKSEALGYHYFSYRFDSSKKLYLRIVYSFINIKTSEIEYFINSELINIQ